MLMKDTKAVVQNLIGSLGNPYTKTLSEEIKNKRTIYYDTGVLLLNGMFSGDMTKGIPSGMVYTLFGDQAAGKSSIAMQAATEALKNYDNQIVFYFESEGANTEDYAYKKLKDEREKLSEEYGDRFIIPRIETIEGLTTQVRNLLKHIRDNKLDKKWQFMFIVDSIGLLSSLSELKNIENDDIKANVGTNQKLIKGFFRSVIHPLRTTNTTMLVIAHQYDKIGSFFGGKELAGGSGVRLASTNIFQLTKYKNIEEQFKKNEKGNIVKDGESQTGLKIKILAWKSRYVGEGKTFAHFYQDYQGGIEKYSGMFELMIKFGIMKENKVRGKGTTFEIPHLGLEFTKKDLVTMSLSEIFTDEIIYMINEKWQDEYSLAREKKDIRDETADEIDDLDDVEPIENEFETALQLNLKRQEELRNKLESIDSNKKLSLENKTKKKQVYAKKLEDLIKNQKDLEEKID
jgi:RecA/RadA recombinase